MPAANEMSIEEARKLEKKLDREKWEIMFVGQLDAEGFYLGEDPESLLPGEYVREFKWHPKRRWRSDLLIAKPGLYKIKNVESWKKLFIADLILVELHGATHSQGGHTRGVGFQKDRIKYNTATAMGWEVYEFTGEQVKDGSAIKFLIDHVFDA